MTPVPLVENTAAAVTIKFTTANPIPTGGKIEVTFPTGFGLAGTTAPAISTDTAPSNVVLNEPVEIDGRNLIFTTGAEETPGGAAITIVVDNITNPGASSTDTGTFAIKTYKSDGAEIDSASLVPGVTITGGSTIYL